MKDGPNFAAIASLMGDPARGNMLAALMDGRALTASELAAEAGVTKQTASAHLAKLIDGGLLRREVQGRHHYLRLGGPDVARALETLMGLAQVSGGRRARPGPSDPALRKARVCYDHLAGDMGVLMFRQLRAQGLLAGADDALRVGEAGWRHLAKLGVTPEERASTRRPECRACLDWSARTHHLAGSVGKAILSRVLDLGWARRVRGSRVIAFGPSGERHFRQWIGAR